MIVVIAVRRLVRIKLELVGIMSHVVLPSGTESDGRGERYAGNAVNGFYLS